jgi:hypothetical protein
MTIQSDHHETTTNPADEATVRDLYQQLMDGWNGGSGESFAAVFTQDGELVAFDGTHFKGRSEIAPIPSATLRQVDEGDAPRRTGRDRAVPEQRCSPTTCGGRNGDARQNRAFAGTRLSSNTRRHTSGRRMAPRCVPEHPGPGDEQRGRVPGMDVFGLAVEGFSP